MGDFKQKLQAHIDDLANRLENPNRIVRICFAKKILQQEEFEEIKTKRNKPIAQMEYLIDLLLRKNDEHHISFLEVLKETNNTYSYNLLCPSQSEANVNQQNKGSTNTPSSSGNAASIAPKETVVDIMLKDPILINNWKQLYRSLSLPTHELVRLDRGYKADTMPIKEIMHEIMNLWDKESKNGWTIGDLCQVLESQKFMSVSGNLEKRFALGDLIK